MYNDPNQPQQPGYGPPPSPYGQSPYGQPQPPSGSSPYGPPQQPYGQAPWGQQAQAQYGPPQYGQVPLQYVGVGWRFLAILIDSIILGIVFAVIGAAFGGAQASGGNASVSLTGAPALLAIVISFLYFIVLEALQTGAPALLVFVISFLYFIVLEALQGATVGKMILGLRVVKTNGAPITWTDSLIRNELRIIDGLFSYLVGAILIWTSPLKQRLGDRLANTMVVKRPR